MAEKNPLKRGEATRKDASGRDASGSLAGRTHAASTARLERPLKREFKLLYLEGLRQEIGGAALHRLDDVARASLTGEHHDGHVVPALLEVTQLERLDVRKAWF